MALHDLIAYVLLASLVIYALTGGADFGGGMWDVAARGARGRRRRAAIEEAIAPIWEANHVWLILAVVLVFTAFPPAFGVIMTALHIPLTIVLVGIVLRGSAFVFRKYDRTSDAAHERWSRVFAASSFLTPFFLGLALGALSTGKIRAQGGLVSTGFFAGWTTPFAAGCGLFVLALFAYLAAVYLTVDTRAHPDLQEDFRRRALLAGGLLAPLGLGVYLLARDGAPGLYAGLFAGRVVPLALTLCAAAGAMLALWLRRFELARVLAAVQVALVVALWGAAQYPYLVAPDVSVTSAVTHASTLRMLAITLACGAVLLFPSFAYLFYVFKRRPVEVGDA